MKILKAFCWKKFLMMSRLNSLKIKILILSTRIYELTLMRKRKTKSIHPLLNHRNYSSLLLKIKSIGLTFKIQSKSQKLIWMSTFKISQWIQNNRKKRNPEFLSSMIRKKVFNKRWSLNLWLWVDLEITKERCGSLGRAFARKQVKNLRVAIR